MSELHSLIRACKAEPHDNAPRLILSDWLEEHGECERAQFIRHQVANPEKVVDPACSEWLGAWKQWADQWMVDMAWLSKPDYPVSIRRGFLRISDYYVELYNRLSDILRPPFDWTWVESIQFGSWHDGDWTPLFESPRLLELNRLVFIDDHYRSNLIPPLAACPYLVNLKELHIGYLADGHGGLSRLSQSDSLSGLRSFSFDISNAGKRAARAFAQSNVWDQLRSCQIRCSDIGDGGLGELAWGRARPLLTRLDISHGRYTDDGLGALARSDRFPNLRELSIGSSIRNSDNPRIGPRGLEALLTSPLFQKVHITVYWVSPEPMPVEFFELQTAYRERLDIDAQLLARIEP